MRANYSVKWNAAVSPHRDRDFLTDEEVLRWGEEYTNRRMVVFCPRLPDIESYYVQAEHLATIYAQPIDQVREVRDAIVAANVDDLRAIFRSKRQDANRKFWVDGAGPATDALWPPDQPASPGTTLGKRLLPRINEEFANQFGRRENLFDQACERLSQELRDFLHVNDI